MKSWPVPIELYDFDLASFSWKSKLTQARRTHVGETQRLHTATWYVDISGHGLVRSAFVSGLVLRTCTLCIRDVFFDAQRARTAKGQTCD